MWSKLEEVFEALGYPYARQGSFQEGETPPESLFTFWNADTPEEGFYDNQAHKAVWVWYVYAYTKNANLIYTMIDEFINEAKKKGFIMDGKAHDIPSDAPDYFGRYVALRYVENYSEGE